LVPLVYLSHHHPAQNGTIVGRFALLVKLLHAAIAKAHVRQQSHAVGVAVGVLRMFQQQQPSTDGSARRPEG
jgi:hypothetical protein